MIKKTIKRLLRKSGFRLMPIAEIQSRRDIRDHAEFQNLYKLCKPFTMTSEERMFALYLAMEYIVQNNISGDLVECGVWKGGSAMLMAEYLALHNIKDKSLFLYDTYEGMTEPTEVDVDLTGKKASAMFNEMSTGKDTSTWCYSSLEEVKENMGRTNFSKEKIFYIKGKVEETIPKIIPQNGIALLRLDTDWYESTKHELIHLYPPISSGGVLIIDDFGFWGGSKKAVVEYFEKHQIKMLLNRIDVTGRVGVKR